MKKLITAVFIIFVQVNDGFSQVSSGTIIRYSDPEAPQYAGQTENTLILTDPDVGKSVMLFAEILNNIQNNYYKEVDIYRCAQTTFKQGVSSCTDRYSFYLNNQEQKKERLDLNGEIEGIGTIFKIENSKATGNVIKDIIEGSPAERAGLAIGDTIIAISTDPVNAHWLYVKNLSLNFVEGVLQGNAGTSILIKILRGEQEKDFLLTRAVVKIKLFETKDLGKFGYVKIKKFSGNDLAKDFLEAINGLKDSGKKVLILDIRDNHGGRLDQVIQIASFFSNNKDSATIIYDRNRAGLFTDHTALGRSVGALKDLEVVVLQNRNSASASEILSGYLKEYCDAIVVGKNSFGKGIVQSIIPLEKYGGVLHLTVAEYFIGKNLIKIHGIGVTPTVEVDDVYEVGEDGENLKDQQLEKALEEAEKLVK